MTSNRSVPVEAILPHLTYSNLEEAVEWLCTTFGFVEHYRYGDPASGAQLYLGDAYVMVGTPKAGFDSPAAVGVSTPCLTTFVDEVEAHYTRTKETGARIVEDLQKTVYGELQYGVRDV
jgi:uncharacterized glyoxalase superfamily protein PhnB